jgi:hypothetical protein
MPTAAWMGRKSVAANVVAARALVIVPVLQIETASGRSIVPQAATSSNAASAGVTTYATRPEKTRRTNATQIPAATVAHLVRAPLLTLSPVWPREQPTGIPRTRPDATFA